jgi:preprotein translocase subunit SecD
MYHFSPWKYWLVIAVMVLGLLFFLPNVFGEDPALQLARQNRQAIDAVTEQRVLESLKAKAISIKESRIEEERLVLRFDNNEVQSQARDALVAAYQTEFSVALSRASAAPYWMRWIGLKPMSLGLDLRGGVRLMFEVDLQDAVKKAIDRTERGIRTALRDKRISSSAVVVNRDEIRVTLKSAEQLQDAIDAIKKAEDTVAVTSESSDAGPVVVAKFTPAALKLQQDEAIEKNLTILRKRVDELGVAEPVVQRQGRDRVVVELPGVQDANQAIRVLRSTTTLEWHMADDANDAEDAQRTNRIPPGSRLAKMRDGRPILMKRELIVSGSQMVNARSSSGNNGLPAVDVTLNGPGGNAMLKNTQVNVGKRMAVLSIDKTRVQPGETCSGVRADNWCTQEVVISAATIQGVFGSKFIITGLSTAEASELALLLRAGSLDTPIALVASTVIGPSLGQDNINRGMEALAIGLLLTFAFMAVYYRAFGWIANAVLLSNLILTVGLLSMIQASLSLPGIAAVVFHLGIAVDANILIYERIREELRMGNSPQAAINAGFEKAFATIADSNVTTLIAGVVLMALGSGTILSFAIVMTLGILTSLFTSVVGSRALVHFIWGRRKRVESLSI